MNNKLATNNSPLTIKNVPALRFPEFSEDWNANGLGKVAKIERGRFSPRPRNDPKYYGGNIPFVQTSDVVNAKGRIRKYSQTLNKKGLVVSKLFPKGSLLITIAANIGFAGVLEQDMACPDSLIGLTCTKALNNYFLNYILEISQPKMDYLAVEAAQKNINIEFLRPYKIQFPTLPEQQKIASFLTSVDTKIEQLGKKKALLEQYKKGMMQKLFSQALRFKDEQGNDFPDWEEKRFKDVVNTYRLGGNYSNLETKTDAPLIKMGNIGRGNIVINKIEYIKYDEIIDENDRIKYGDLFFNTRNTLDLVGKVAIWRGELKIAYFNSNLMKISFDNNFFMNYQMNTQNGIKSLRRIATGTTSVAAIYTKDLLKIWLSIPDIEEQQKIANFLSALDQKIDLIATELKQAQTFKKGLLQQMFV